MFFYINQKPKTSAPIHLQQFAFSGVGKSRKHLLVLLNSDLRKTGRHECHSRRRRHRRRAPLPLHWAHRRWNGRGRLWRSILWRCISAAGCPSWSLRPAETFQEPPLLLAFFRGLEEEEEHERMTNLLVDLDGFLVLLQLSAVSSNLQQTLVSRAERKSRKTWKQSKQL